MNLWKSHDERELAGALLSTTLIQIMATSTALALTPIAPHAAADFGVGAYLIGYQISLTYFAGMFGSAIAGTLIARYGAVRIEQAALALFSAGLVGLSTAHLAAGAFASLLIGVGYGIQNPASSQILGKLCPPDRRNMIFSIKQAGVPIGGVVAAVLFPRLDLAFGWRTAFPLLALLPLLLIWFINRHKKAAPHKDVQPLAQRPIRSGYLKGFLAEQKLVWSQSELRILAVLGLLYSAAQLCLSTFLVLMLVENVGWSLLKAAGIAALVQFFGAFGRIFWGMLADKTGSGFAILGLIGIASGLIMMVMPIVTTLTGLALVAILCMLGMCINGWNGVAMAEMTHYAPQGQIGRVVGGALVYIFLGVMVGPSGFAVLMGSLLRYDYSFILMGVASLLGGVLAMFAFWKGKPQNPEEF